MGRVGGDESQHQPPAAAGDPPPPPPLEEDLYEPPEDYQPPPLKVQAFPPPQADVQPQAFPPPQAYPPNQHFNISAQQNQNYFQPQQINNNNMGMNMNMNMNVPQPGIPMGFVPSPLVAQPWKTHLFDCTRDPQNALITLFFPCVTFGQIAEILDNGGTSCSTSGIMYSLITFFIAMPCLVSCGYRSKLRAKFGLVESPAPDWLVHCFCECCALCQEYRELNERGFDPSIGYAGNMAKQQRLHQLGMTPPPQQRMI